MNDELAYFNEDASEQLQMMESALLDAMDQGANSEYIGTIFRAMHTIKGIAGMFSFDEIISFTHIAENLMDAVRNGEIELDEDLLILLLQCKDHVAHLVNFAVASEEVPSDVLEKDAQLKKVIGEYLQIPQTQSSSTSSLLEPTQKSTIWNIEIILKESFFQTGMDMLSILSFMKKMGTIESITPHVDNIPALAEINPLYAYLSFSIVFLAHVAQSEIEEVFEFVEDDVELQISKDEEEDGVFFVDDDEIEGVVFVDENPVLKEQPSEGVEKKGTVPQKRSQQKTLSQSLRVDSSKIDLLIDTISEMVITNAKIAAYVDQYNDAELEEVSMQFESLLDELRNNVMNIRMVPVGDSFEKLRRVVSDVAHKLEKKINFTIIGGDTELDKTVVEKIADPLLHMLRNAIDHGIEIPKVRKEIGKPEMGQVTLKAYPDSGSIVIEIEDDGKGLSKDFILEKAISKGIVNASAELSDNEVFQLIFEPGFSTAEVISDISGRGVGMDVVRKNIEALKGDVELFSEVGVGSRFTIRLPLTLAIIDGFLFQVGKTKYIIPLDMVSEVVEYEIHHRISVLDGNLFDLRGTLLPLLNVREFYKESECYQCERQNIIIVQYGRNKMGLLVDELYGEYQTVIKPLGELFSYAPGLYGASILGSGEIALIFDIPSLFEILNTNKGE